MIRIVTAALAVFATWCVIVQPAYSTSGQCCAKKGNPTRCLPC